MSKLIHVASATATIAAAVLLPLLVTLLLNDGSLVTASATGNAAAIALRGPLAAADTVALLLASSLILLSAACACSCNVVGFGPFFSLVMNRHGDVIAFWAEPAWWRSVSRPRPSVPYSLLATNYQLLTTITDHEAPTQSFTRRHTRVLLREPDRSFTPRHLLVAT